jgi:hypothetical protein
LKRLSESQKHEFETLGFLCLKQLIPPDEMREYIDAFDETMVKANGGQPWTGAPLRQQVVPFYKHNPAVYHRMLDSEHILEVVEDLLGEDFVFAVSEGIQHYEGSKWHHDSISPEGHTHIKMGLYLDPVRADTGCLSILPGSQYTPYRERMEKYGDEILSLDRKVPGTYPIESDPGDVVVFDVKLYHGAFGNNLRRAIYLNFYQKPVSQEESEHIIKLYRNDSTKNGWTYYTPELFENASPRRMQMLAFLKEHCYDDAKS